MFPTLCSMRLYGEPSFPIYPVPSIWVYGLIPIPMSSTYDPHCPLMHTFLWATYFDDPEGPPGTSPLNAVKCILASMPKPPYLARQHRHPGWCVVKDTVGIHSNRIGNRSSCRRKLPCLAGGSRGRPFCIDVADHLRPSRIHDSGLRSFAFSMCRLPSAPTFRRPEALWRYHCSHKCIEVAIPRGCYGNRSGPRCRLRRTSPFTISFACVDNHNSRWTTDTHF